MKYLIVGLGNPGKEYAQTRHNAGFMVLDALSGASNTVFKTDRLADVAEIKYAGRTLVLVKPNTFMNLSGKAVRYWMDSHKVPHNHILVVTDDLSLPLGALRLRAKGSDGGHNGLKDIQAILGHTNYPRLRFGIGAEFSKGFQVDYVLGEFSVDEKPTLEEAIDRATLVVKSFVKDGLQMAASKYNGEGKKD
jgi:PTH1 family peptidyl-tRNA hydrolase